jgi:hypothetical protein
MFEAPTCIRRLCPNIAAALLSIGALSGIQVSGQTDRLVPLARLGAYLSAIFRMSVQIVT